MIFYWSMLYAQSNGSFSDTIAFPPLPALSWKENSYKVLLTFRGKNWAVFLLVVRINLICPDLSKDFSHGERRIKILP